MSLYIERKLFPTPTLDATLYEFLHSCPQGKVP